MKNIVTSVLLLLLVQTANGQKQQHETFSPNEFFGEKEFFDATQDQYLNIYFKSNKDILKFNGTEFSKIILPHSAKTINQICAYNGKLFYTDLSKTYAYDFEKDSTLTIWDQSAIQFQLFEGNLWMISKNKLVQLVDGDNEIQEVYSASKNEILFSFNINLLNTTIGHSKGLTILNENKTPKRIGTFLSNPSKIISVDSNIYILNKSGLFNYYDGVISRLFDNKVNIKDFFIDDFGKTWIVDVNGKIWVNDGIEKENLSTIIGEIDFTINKLFNDRENNLWLLGDNKVIKIVQNNPFSKLEHTDVRDVFTGEKGNLLVGTTNLIHYNFYDKKTTLKIPKNESPLDYVHAFELDSDWIVVFNNNIYQWNISENKIKLLQEESNFIPLASFSKDSILAYKDRSGLFYLNSKYQPYSEVCKLRSFKKLEVFVDKIIAFENQKTISLFNFNTNELISTPLPDSINSTDLVIGNGGYWYFTDNHIYFIDKKGAVTTLQSSQYDVLNNTSILNLFDDQSGNLWVSTKDNLLRLPITFKDNKISIGSIVTYNNNDFLISSFFKYARRGPSDLLWFVNPMGISLFNPLKEIPNLTPPGIFIEKAYSYSLDEFRNPTDTVNLLEGKKTINRNAIVVIEAVAINHVNNQKSYISYKNLSINQTERKIKSGEKIILTDFEDGLNTISLRAVNKDGIESVNKEILNMTVNPPIWKRNWFYLSSILSLLLLGFIGYKTVINIKNSRAKELEDELHKGLEDLEKKSHLQVLKAERLKQLNDLITSQKGELEKKNAQIESQKYELSLTNQQIKKQKDLLEETSSKLKSSINYAKRIQNALMSTEVEIKKAFQESFVYFLPRDVVSGDFFWFNKFNNEKNEELHILAAVDCTGHGVPGAIVSVVGMNLLNNITRLKKIYDPGQILTEMNYDIIADLRQDETQVNDGMDMTIVTYNTVTKQLLFAGAKNPLMYVEDDELIRIKGDKYAIGGQQRGSDREFQTHHLDLTDGKKRSFYLFSDGYQDQFGGDKGFKYLTGNFKKLLLKIHDKDVLEQKTILHEEIEDWKEGYQQTDDILVIGFRL